MMTIDHFRRVKLHLGLIPIALFILISLGCSPSNAQPSQGLRAIWIWSTANSAERIDEMLDRAVRGGFNTVLYYIGSGRVHYNSALLPRSPYVTSEYDPLAYVVEQGHARGLKVQAWWCPGTAPRDSEFASWYSDLDIALREGTTTHWLDFSNPEARQLVADVAVEIAENYDVDGVHMDYIRYAYDCGTQPCHHYDYFSADDVSSAVKLAWQQLKTVEPNVQLTAAVLSYGGKWHLQNWADWLAQEYIDYVMPMAYYPPEQNDELRQQIKMWQGLSHPERIVPGLIVYTGKGANKVPKTPEQLIAQIEMGRAGGFWAFSMFDEKNITDEILDALAASLE